MTDERGFKSGSMNPIPTEWILGNGGYVVFSQKNNGGKGLIYYNREAWKIFSYAVSHEKGGGPDVGGLCKKWKGLLDAQSSQRGKATECVDVYQSKKRHYVVRGIPLSSDPHQEEKPFFSHYLFLLDRVIPDKVNLPMVARKWRLSPREEEIVRLLLMDQGNKEMAKTMQISLNTVKGYLKLLMRKLGVSSRAGIVVSLLTEKREN